jgi:hypothetical protein
VATGKYAKIGGAIKAIVGEYAKVGGVIVPITVNCPKVGGAIKEITLEKYIFLCEKFSDRLYGIDDVPAVLDGWPKYGGGIADPDAVAVDGDNNSYWACWPNIYKVAVDGTIVWTNTDFSVPVEAICVDVDGNVYAGDTGGAIRKINSSGTTQWTKQPYTGTVHALALDYSDGQLYAAYGIGAAGRIVRLLTLNGNWANVYYNATKNFFSVAIDEGVPSLYIGDNNGDLRKISTGGYVYWTVSKGGEIYAVRVGHDGYGYYANGSGRTTAQFVLSTGGDSWSLTPGGGTADAMDVAVDQFGNAYAVYRKAGTSVENVVRKINSAGDEQWTWQPYVSAQWYGVAVTGGIKAAGF